MSALDVRTKVIWMGVVGLLVAWPAAAQVVNPSAAIFTASADHATVVNGVAVVESYQLDLVTTAAGGALALTVSLGKPTPSPTNEITADIASSVAKLATGAYVATVVAVGPGGAGRSAPSDPFFRLGTPAPPGRPSLK